MIKKNFLEAKTILSRLYISAQQMDAELASPEISIEPADTYITKAVNLLKTINPQFFVGVRKIVVDTGQGLGHVESGPGKDPAVIHINLSRIKNDIANQLKNVSEQDKEKAIIRQLALTISHERQHVASYNLNSGFTGGEASAESAEKEMLGKLTNLNPTQ